jgi:hypothetical protein
VAIAGMKEQVAIVDPLVCKAQFDLSNSCEQGCVRLLKREEMILSPRARSNVLLCSRRPRDRDGKDKA